MRTIVQLLVAAQGTPFWQLRITAAELAQLRQALVVAPPGLQRDKMFVLVAAEMLRRHYGGGPYSWALLRQHLGLGWAHDDNALRHATDRGLNALDRPLIVVAPRQFRLSTLVREGGLPTARLLAADGWEWRWCRRLLDGLVEHGADGPQHQELAEDLALRLAPAGQTRRCRAWAPLVADLVLGVRQLIAQVPRADGQSLTDWLAITVPADWPNWDQSLPIDLDDGHAAQLVVALAHEAERHVATRPPVVRVSMAQTTQGDWLVHRTLTVPRTLSLAALQDTFPGLPNMFPRRLSLQWSCGGERGEAAQLVRKDQGSFRTYGQDVVLPPHRGTLGVTLFGANRGGVAAQGLAHTSPLPDDQPWVFHQHGAKYQLAAVGGCEHPATELWVVLPSGCTVPPGAWGHAGSWNDGGATRDVMRVHGQTTITIHGRQFTITPNGQAPDGLGFLVPRGVPHRWSPTANVVFDGWPAFQYQSEHGVIQHVPPAQIAWNTGGGWQAALPPPAGHVDVRWVQPNGTVRGETSLTWLPANRGLILANVGPNQGTLAPVGNVTLSIPAPHVGFTFQAEHGSLILTAGQQPPPRVSVKVHVNQGNPVRLHVPMPIHRAVFYDRSGGLLNGVVALRHLSGTVLQVLHPGQGQPYLRLSLYPPNEQHPSNEQEVVVPGDGAVYELDLGTVRDQIGRLLALTNSVDAEVRLTPWVLGGNGPPIGGQVTVKRYDRALVRQNGDVALNPQLPQPNAGVDPTAHLRVQGHRLDTPSESVDLARLHPGQRWILPQDLPDGCWLITARTLGGEIARPTVVVQGMPAAAAPDTLFAAAQQATQGGRLAAYEARMGNLLPQPDDAELAFARHHLTLLQYTSAGGLDLVRALASCPTLAARFAVEFAAGDPTFFRTYWNAMLELPFLWSTVPVAAWRGAVAALRASLGQLPANLQDRIVNTALDRISEPVPALRAIFEDPPPNVQALPLLLQGELVQARGELLGRHVNQQWPGQPLAAGMPLDPRLTAPQMNLPYQTAVLLLPFQVATAILAGTLLDADRIHEIRTLRDFDPIWYLEALWNALAQAQLAANPGGP